MAREMHAEIVEQFGKPLMLRACDIPTPAPGQILVKTEACGVCHTDIHAADRQLAGQTYALPRPAASGPRLP